MSWWRASSAPRLSSTSWTADCATPGLRSRSWCLGWTRWRPRSNRREAMTMSDVADGQRLYFRQLLSGRDFARGDQMARQMVNFVYLIGDRATGEAVVVDPAYAVADLLGILEEDGMR